MDRPHELKLLDEALQRVTDKARFLSDEASTVPVRYYVDPERYARELDALFARRMHFVGHGSQLPKPRDFITLCFAGTPLLVSRQDDGSVRAFLNVCRHRGATLELREHGSGQRFVCPYHAWTYGCDGRLVRVRHPDGFPNLELEEHGLVEVPCVEQAGLLAVCPTPKDRVTAPKPPAGEALLADLHWLGVPGGVVFASCRQQRKANWKILVDGGLESYHFRIAHRNTIGPAFGDNASSFEILGEHVRSVLPRTSISVLPSTPRSDWSLRSHAHLVYSILPSSTILTQHEHFDFITMVPTAVDETRIEIFTVVPDPGPAGFSDGARRHWMKNHELTVRTLSEDFELAEQIQRGLHTGANEAFRFARYEGALRRWHRWIEEQLSDAADAAS
jgi:phenylpropionate dioxygenase-like ring-hydroxylating dioxygenase large terminal subunit